MIKVGIYCLDSKQKKEIKNFVSQYFKEIGIESKINYIRTKNIALKNIQEKKIEYNIMILCDDGKITCIKRNAMSLLKNYSSITIGWTELPLDFEKMDDIVINIDNDNCPCKIFPMNTKKTLRAISHGDIEYCKRIGRKTIMYLKDDETEELSESIKTLKTKMPENYFTDCLYGYIVNFYNIKKIDRTNRKLILKSGTVIPISKNKNKTFIRQFFKVIFGI